MTPERPRATNPVAPEDERRLAGPLAGLTSDSDIGGCSSAPEPGPEILYTPGHTLHHESPPNLPLHHASVPSSPSGDVASSEEESVAELEDVSGASCSSVEDFVVDVVKNRLPGSTSEDIDSKLEPQQDRVIFSEHAPEGPVDSPGVTAPSPPDKLPDSSLEHQPTIPVFKDTRTCMWTSSHAANCPSEDRSSSLVNVLLQPHPPTLPDRSTFVPDYTTLIRLNLWSVIDGHGGGCVATYASEVLLPHIAASVSRALGCAIVDRGVCTVNGQLRDANALDLDGLIKTSDRSVANPNSIQYRSPYEHIFSEEEDAGQQRTGGISGTEGDTESHHSGDRMSESETDGDTESHRSEPISGNEDVGGISGTEGDIESHHAERLSETEEAGGISGTEGDTESHHSERLSETEDDSPSRRASSSRPGRRLGAKNDGSPRSSRKRSRVTPLEDSEASIASSLLPRSEPAASISSVKTSVKTAASPATRDAPVGTHSPSEVAAITRAITESFLAVDEGWINSIDPIATHQTSCQSNGRWNAGACALVVFTIQRLDWTSVSETVGRRELRGLEKCRGHDTSQNRDAARRRMLDYAARAKSASSVSTMSSCSSLTTAEEMVNVSGLESEITETEGEYDDRSTDGEARRRFSSRSNTAGASLRKESLISTPGGCSCHFYRAHQAIMYTAHVGDCRAVMLGSAPPRTIKVRDSSIIDHPDTTDDESSHHSSDETECLSSSDHDAESSDDEADTESETGPGASAKKSAYMTYMRRPARRSRRRVTGDTGVHAPFIALPPLDRSEGFRSIDIEVENAADRRERRHRSGLEPSDSSTSSEDSNEDIPPIIYLPTVARPIDLTTDHSAYNPAEVTAVLRRCNNAPRAISAGGGGGIKRVAGSLAVTRALGDAYLKTPQLSFFPYKRHAPYITARPEVNCRPVIKGGDKVLILATDGVWERASGDDVLRWVRNFYAERIAEAERRSNRRCITQTDRVSNDGSPLGSRSPQETAEQENENEVDFFLTRKRQTLQSPSPPAKRRKRPVRCSRRGSLVHWGSSYGSSVADVIVRRVLNKVRRARNISSLHALMSLPAGRARRSKHDDITACVVDMSAFVS